MNPSIIMVAISLGGFMACGAAEDDRPPAASNLGSSPSNGGAAGISPTANTSPRAPGSTEDAGVGGISAGGGTNVGTGDGTSGGVSGGAGLGANGTGNQPPDAGANADAGTNNAGTNVGTGDGTSGGVSGGAGLGANGTGNTGAPSDAGAGNITVIQ